jgi:hypothetical protein
MTELPSSMGFSFGLVTPLPFRFFAQYPRGGRGISQSAQMSANRTSDRP